MSAQLKLIRLFLSICILTFITIAPATAGVSLSLGTGYLSGDTQYRIGGRVITADEVVDLHFPISELKFPLDATMLQAAASVDISKRWSFLTRAAINLTDDTGKMEDSDWGVYSSNPKTLDVFSKSDTEMDALLLEGKITYLLYQGYYGQSDASERVNQDIQFSYYLGLGYKYQRFDFDVSNVHQWYPSAPSEPHDRISGLALIYEAEYQIPYLELSMDMDIAGKFLLEIGLGYAPWINFKDKDQHLLRDKVNKADHDWDGNAAFARLKGRYNITPRWFVDLDLETMQIRSEGRSSAYFSGVWDHSIEHKIKSKQYSAYVSMGGSFW